MLIVTTTKEATKQKGVTGRCYRKPQDTHAAQSKETAEGRPTGRAAQHNGKDRVSQRTHDTRHDEDKDDAARNEDRHDVDRGDSDDTGSSNEGNPTRHDGARTHPIFAALQDSRCHEPVEGAQAAHGPPAQNQQVAHWFP